MRDLSRVRAAWRTAPLVLAAIPFALGCAGHTPPAATTAAPSSAPATSDTTPPSGRAPRAVRRDLPLGPMIRRAYAAGTRDSTGRPGAHYWQQTVDYVIEATLQPDSALLRGTETITLHNTSPDTLHSIVLRLLQNYFRAESPRNDYVTDVTQGMQLARLTVNGTTIDLTNRRQYRVNGTIATVRLANAIAPGADAALSVAWSFVVPNVPQGERGERMGRWGTTLYQMAQWYPQIAMYDDLRGWDADPYLGIGEFYNQFGSYDVKITVPAGWLVGATGTLANPEEVLSAGVRDRLALAMRVDSTVHVVTTADRGAGKATPAGRALTWHFTAPMVNDVAFLAARDVVWDATHAMAPDPTLVSVLYLPEHAQYAQSAQLGRFALEHHARFLMPYAFPQATIVDGPETGMEYPMIIFSGPGEGVITHELGHEWFPMMVGSNETWYGWQDEGLNEFIDFAAAADHTHTPTDWLDAGASYREVAGSELEPAMMWPSDYAGPAYGEQAYVKAPVALHALGAIVGDSAVDRALAEYARAWRFKHPSPWDFFMSMNRSLGRDLDWFWAAWWFGTEAFDQGIAGVQQLGDSARVTVADHGGMAMPVILRVEYGDGTSEMVQRPASVWFGGARETSVAIPLRGRRVARITLDPEHRFQDVQPDDNAWPGGSR
ncbi:MAG TPA: M1 family metallopeptidase [Gemmatimonadaceae bacterium]|nr:M1 family metallopeptidase [Gemmatimonadaceae bacterium]